jgi:DNA modification methylase
MESHIITKGYSICSCNAPFDSGIVLDPFCGSGTTCVVAKKLGRHFIGIELNPNYARMSEKRLSKVPLRLDSILRGENETKKQ